MLLKLTFVFILLRRNIYFYTSKALLMQEYLVQSKNIFLKHQLPLGKMLISQKQEHQKCKGESKL